MHSPKPGHVVPLQNQGHECTDKTLQNPDQVYFYKTQAMYVASTKPRPCTHLQNPGHA